MPIQFELRHHIREGYSLDDSNPNDIKVVFEIRPIVGIVGNTYDGFTSSKDIITVICNKSDTGDQMDTDIITACQNYVSNNYPDII